jgi:hypothetical protein
MANLIDKIKSGASKIGDKISSALRLEKTNKSEGIAPGATASTPAPAKPTFNGVPDFRPKLIVPYEYVASDLTAGPNAFIRSAQGIVFPYTPDIRQEQMANFNAKELTHSNYPFYLENIYISGINPHCGENGIYGSEDKNLIEVIKSFQNQNIKHLHGPFSGDTL